jgi:hypothetical protein
MWTEVADQRGTLLVEALVSLVLLAGIVAGVLQVHAAAASAHHRAVERLVAAWAVRAAHESIALLSADLPGTASGMSSPAGDGAAMTIGVSGTGAHPVIVTNRPAGLVTSGRGAHCGGHPTPPDATPTILAGVAVTARSVARGTVVTGLVGVAPRSWSAAAASSARGRVIVQMTGSDGLPLEGVEVAVGTSTAVTGREGCAVLPTGAQGLLLVITPGLVDRRHVPADTLPPVIVPVGAAPLVHLALDVAVPVRVALDHPGARAPDTAPGGPLRWWLDGDPAGRTASLEEALWVHPGAVDVIVGACDRSTAAGSRARGHVSGDDGDPVVVRLATIEVVLPAIDGPAHLEAMRDRDCPGSSGERPVLAWSLRGDELVEGGVRIALPTGPWRLRLLQSGIRVAGPLPVQAGIDAQVVLVP